MLLFKGLVPVIGSGLLFCQFRGAGLLARQEASGVVRMQNRATWTLFWVALVALLAGAGLGLWYGWVVNPVEYKDTDVAHLYSVYRDEFILMVAEAYAIEGDLDAARARLALLSLPDPANTVADMAETILAQGGSRLDIQALARLAAALGVQRETLRPYLGLAAFGLDGWL